MEILICFLMTLGIKLSYFFAVLVVKREDGRRYLYGVAATVFSFGIEVVGLAVGIDFVVFTSLLVGQLFVVAIALVAYLWIAKINRNLINVAVVFTPFVMMALKNYSRLQGDDVVLMVISWLLGGAFCSTFMYLVCDIPDKKKQDILLKEIKDDMSMRENQMEMVQIYEDISKKCLNNIVGIRQNLEKKINENELDEAIKQSVSDLRIKEYCSNTIVNQIIYQIENRCKENGTIAFDAEVNVNSIITIDDLDISSVLLNLLDNAYNYCVLDVKSQSKFIKLKMETLGDFLQIDVMNSYSGKIKDTRKRTNPIIKEHGWGRLIINDIALKYDGNYQTRIEKECYIDSVILCCEVKRSNDNNN